MAETDCQSDMRGQGRHRMLHRESSCLNTEIDDSDEDCQSESLIATSVQEDAAEIVVACSSPPPLGQKGVGEGAHVVESEEVLLFGTSDSVGWPAATRSQLNGVWQFRNRMSLDTKWLHQDTSM